jgi:hypothetical protein
MSSACWRRAARERLGVSDGQVGGRTQIAGLDVGRDGQGDSQAVRAGGRGVGTAAVRGDDLGGDGEAKARAVADRGGAVEALEDVRELAGRHASYEQQLVNANQQALTAAVQQYRAAYGKELGELPALLKTASAQPYPPARAGQPSSAAS